MTEQTPVIHIVDDDESLRKAFTRLLQAAGYRVRSYSSAGEFLLAGSSNSHGCIVLDVHLPGLSGLDLQAGIRDHECALPIIFITGHGDIPMTVKAMKAGAVDFLTKPVPRDALLSAIRNALVQDSENRAALDRSGVLHSRFATLTLRERAVFELVVVGRMNKHIAAELGISERTVKAHRAQVMVKMNVESLAELVSVAVKLNADSQCSNSPS
jgi:FixJ family two-component response regulator